MATAAIDEEKLKALLKSAVGEAFEEHRDLLREIVEESLEEVALSRAIQNGLSTPTVSRDEIFTIRENEH